MGFSGGSSTWVLFCMPISLKSLAKSFRLTGASEPAEASEGLAEGVVGASSAVSSDPAEGELKKDMIRLEVVRASKFASKASNQSVLPVRLGLVPAGPSSPVRLEFASKA